MSTVLDALAKADSKGSTGPESVVPSSSGGPPKPPPPRSRFWRAVGFAVLVVVAFLVGMFTDEEEGSQPVVATVAEDGSSSQVARDAGGDTGKDRDSEPLVETAALDRVDAASASGSQGSGTVGAQAQGRSDAEIAVSTPPVVAAPAEEKAAQEKTPQAKANQEKRQAERKLWRAKRMAAREAAREARARARSGEITKEQYRYERRERRAEARVEREEQKADRREEQLARRKEIRDQRAAARADSVAEPEGAVTEPSAAPRGTTSAAGAAAPTVAALEQEPSAASSGAPVSPPEGHSLEVRRWMPAGAPPVRIQILQWSRDDSRRFAFLSVDGGRATRVSEGTVLGPVQIKTIYREMIEIQFGEQRFLLRAN